MSKVLTFSTKFPSHHVKKGEPTFFVEKIWTSLFQQKLFHDLDDIQLEEYIKNYTLRNFKPKNHTIRAGNRFKEGEWFSPRIWSGAPYRSKQIAIAPDIQIPKIYPFSILSKEDKEKCGGTGIFVNNKQISPDFIIDLAENDGLEAAELLLWFKYPSQFYGQIICWNEEVNY